MEREEPCTHLRAQGIINPASSEDTRARIGSHIGCVSPCEDGTSELNLSTGTFTSTDTVPIHIFPRADWDIYWPPSSPD